MPGLVTVCHATLRQCLWGQPLSAGGGGAWGFPARNRALLTPSPECSGAPRPAPTLLQRAQRGANLFS